MLFPPSHIVPRRHDASLHVSLSCSLNPSRRSDFFEFDRLSLSSVKLGTQSGKLICNISTKIGSKIRQCVLPISFRHLVVCDRAEALQIPLESHTSVFLFCFFSFLLCFYIAFFTACVRSLRNVEKIMAI